MQTGIYPEPYKRSGKSIYYFMYTDPRTGRRKMKSTGCEKKRQAFQFIKEFMDMIAAGESEKTFRDYAEPYFIWDTCPRVARKLNHNQTIGKKYVHDSRKWLEKYVFPDDFSKIMMRDLRRAHVLDLQQRLVRKQLSTYTVNNIIKAVKAVLSEAYLREEITRNPGSMVGAIQPKEKADIGFFNPDEIRKFLEHPWRSDDAQKLMTFAAYTGMRESEIRALTWKHVDLDRRIIKVHQAFKPRGGIGLPKWDKRREIPIPEKLRGMLKLHFEDGIFILPDHYVFCTDQGEPWGQRFWYDSFRKQAVSAGLAHENIINEKTKKRNGYLDNHGRKIKPHSLRHSLNTNLLDAGADPYKVRLMLGWSDTGVKALSPVQLGYTHSIGESLSDLADLVDQLYG